MKTRKLVITALFAALTASGAILTIPLPFSPVPITLQIFFTLIAGVILGSKYGALSQIVYLLMGGIGLPVFAKGAAGFQVLLGPTAGYLWGFILCAFVVGLISEKFQSWQMNVFAMLLGLIIIYILGVLGLHFVLGLSIIKAIQVGIVPFLPGDALKLIAAGLITIRVGKRTPFF